MKGGKVIKNAAVIVVSLGVVLFILLYMSGAFRAKVEPGTIVPPVNLATDQPKAVVHRIVDVERNEVVGTLRAVRRAEVSPKVMATVEEVTVRAGDTVKKGDVLVRLDDRDQRARLEQAEQQVLAAEANLERAENDYNRFKDLLEQKVATQQEFDEKAAQYRVAQAELKGAAEAASEAKTMLSYTVIEAPFDGIVVDKLVDIGDTASPGKNLMTLYNPSQLRLEAAVPETLAGGVAVGNPLAVRIDSLDLTLEGTVSEIVPMAEAASRSVLVKVDVLEDPRMVEGQFGRLLIPARERIRYCVPMSAVREVGQLRFVDVVTSESTIDRRQVTLGEHSEMGRIEVLSGLEAGEVVLLHGPPPPPIPEGTREMMGGVVR